ncbi:MAG: hypothetical protein H0X69_03550 [Gemmatimonadales bacterium]|nr:hypothetical protein [Gemmatimonadales bacterium]
MPKYAAQRIRGEGGAADLHYTRPVTGLLERAPGRKKGDLDVTIDVQRESPSTAKVEVTARKNLAEWDKDYAKEVLNRIVQEG